jgi:FkbM family methyltransferase
MITITESFSQFREDVILLSIYSAISSDEHPYFVDVGANDGRSWSNSFLFGKLGWSMLLVEPIPLQASHCRDLYRDTSGVIIEEKAISSSVGVVDFFITAEPGRDLLQMGSSLSSEGVPFGLDSIKTTVETCPLRNLLQIHNCPKKYAILSVDVEGHDLEVLRSAALDVWSPMLVCVEKAEKDAASIDAYLCEMGYRHLVQTQANGIYVKR